MNHPITGVEPRSVAQASGLRPGDELMAINDEPIIDEIDYQALSAQAELKLTLLRQGGAAETLLIHKEDWQPLGLQFGDSMTLKPRTCHNRCAFCFIDQMRPGMRDTLYVKDDDWRFSLMMGNFVTLTNVDAEEMDRIIRRHASPLYVSVHTTDPALRVRMMNNRFAGDILPRLRRLAEAGIRFHCQIVCCPGINDGEALLSTLRDLRMLAPATLSVAIVPVGLTRFRQQLEPLTLFDRESASAFLDMLAPFQEECRQQLGTTLVFPSDEFYCLSGRPIPPAEWYEGYPQIENGVGLLARLEEDMGEAAEDDEALDNPPPRTLVLVTGVSAAPHLQRLTQRYSPEGTQVRVVTIRNYFFGETITVTGLLTGGDTLAQLTPEVLADADELLISANMLRHERDLFLDDMTLVDFQRNLPVPVRIVEDGYDLYEAIHGRITADR